MQLTKWVVRLAGVTVLALSATPGAQVSPSVTFTGIGDAVPNMFFDAAQTHPEAGNPNRLIVGFNTGIDPATFKSLDFKASTEAFGRSAAMDTLSFNVTAPAGYYLATITYAQQGTGSQNSPGSAAGGANWVIGGQAVDLGQFSTNPNRSSTVDISARVLTSVPVSITNSLFAFSTVALGSAEVAVTSADVVVTVLPCQATDGRGNGKGKGPGKETECLPATVVTP